MAGDARGRMFTFPIPTYNITPDFPWDSENADRLFAHDGEVRAAVFPELPQLRAEAEHDPLDVLPPAARPARTAQARQRAVRLGRADRLARRGDAELRAARLSLHKGDEAGLLGARRRAAGDRPHQPGDQAQGHPAAHGRRAVPLHQALPRHAAQPLLHARRQRHQRDDPQLHLRRRGHHDRTGATHSRCASSTTSAAASSRSRSETGHMYNLEATPAEGTTYRFAREDRKRFPGHPAGRHGGDVLLHELVAAAGGLHRRPVRGAAHQEKLQRNTPAAQSLHLYFGERLLSAEACRRLVRRALENFRVPYITVTPTFSVCPRHGYLAGEPQVLPDLRRRKSSPASASARRRQSWSPPNEHHRDRTFHAPSN